MSFSRRRFLGLTAGAGLAAALPAGALNESVQAPLRAPDYDQLTLTGGIARQQQQNTLDVLNTFDDDALLKPFRAMGGMDAPGRDLGGWYQYLPSYNWHTGDAGFCPGHCFGQWTSAMARIASAQQDASLRERVLRLHHLLALAITPQFFNLTRFPAYTLDKLNVGLLDAHALLDSPEALAIANKVRQCALPSLPPSALDRDSTSAWRADRDQSWHWDESYTLPENLWLLYKAGAGTGYANMARAYMLDSFFLPLARNQNVLGGLHGYSHVNALCSAVQAFLVDGNAAYLDAARNGYEMIAAQSYATGGWAPDEVFEKPGSGKLLASLAGTHNSFETPCGTYAFFKLSRYLLHITRDGRYGDAMERILYNSMFGALPLQPDGRTFYYADFSQQARRVYSAHRWPCCAGTYTQVAADYGINAYLLDPGPDPTVWVNLYLPSVLRFQVNNTEAQLTQDTSYPLSERIQLRLQIERPSRFALHLRIPAFCTEPQVHINSQRQPLRRRKGFVTLNRTWRSGDEIVLSLPAIVRLEPFPADGATHTALAALCWGPLVLFPDRAATLSPASLGSVQRTSETEWRTGDNTLSFRPFFAIGNAPYATYLRIV